MQSLRSLARTSTRAFSTSAPRPLAKLQLIGRLADSPEVLPTSTGRELIKFSMGVSQGRRDEEGNRSVSWFEIASFVEGPQRDLLLSLPKGTQLYVESEAKMETYKDREGNNRKGLNLLMRNFEALSRPVNREQPEVKGGAESNTTAAEEPLSGIGQS